MYQVNIQWICYRYRQHLKSWLLRRSDKNLACSGLQLFFWIQAYLRLIYIPNSHQALKLQFFVLTLPIHSDILSLIECLFSLMYLHFSLLHCIKYTMFFVLQSDLYVLFHLNVSSFMWFPSRTKGQLMHLPHFFLFYFLLVSDFV